MRTAFDLEFHPSAAVIRTARDATAVLAPQLSREKLDDLRLVVSELVTNCVRHAGLSSEDWVRVKLSIGANVVRGEVCNPGHGFQVPPVPLELAESGWGMYLVE